MIDGLNNIIENIVCIYIYVVINVEIIINNGVMNKFLDVNNCIIIHLGKNIINGGIPLIIKIFIIKINKIKVFL